MEWRQSSGSAPGARTSIQRAGTLLTASILNTTTIREPAPSSPITARTASIGLTTSQRSESNRRIREEERGLSQNPSTAIHLPFLRNHHQELIPLKIGGANLEIADNGPTKPLTTSFGLIFDRAYLEEPEMPRLERLKKKEYDLPWAWSDA